MSQNTGRELDISHVLVGKNIYFYPPGGGKSFCHLYENNFVFRPSP